jgi:hypothetical protein
MDWSRPLRAVLIAAASFASSAAGATSLTTVGSVPPDRRPAGVPAEYVVTPNGLFHPSCVVKVEDDQRLSASGAVLRVDGSVAQPAGGCTYPRFIVHGDAIERVEPGMRPEYSGWVARSDSNSNITPPAGSSSAIFTVPSGPTTKSGQVLYYFPGLEDGGAVQTILQPVLAWNGFNDSRWTMTNWNCCKSGKTWHGSTILVSTGDRIKGTMKGSGCTGGVCANWQIVSIDKTTGQKTTFNTESYGQAFDWYFGGVKEVYFVTQCSHYPANGSITFKRVHFYDVNGVETTPSDWNHWVAGGVPPCNYQVTTSTHTTTITFNAAQ